MLTVIICGALDLAILVGLLLCLIFGGLKITD
jgi:hypothetical protein